MCGTSVRAHDALYADAAEWLELMRRLRGAADECDAQGRFFTIIQGVHQPKPIQQPCPPSMIAGRSATGARFAAKYADMVFTGIAEDAAETTARISSMSQQDTDLMHMPRTLWERCTEALCRVHG
jgi:alkanesulfonate monooxygenase SsuD/methylene tetrahydromethanopterin reductase-like flavin-dependent oxidoreductase (luciferase family)